MAVGNAIIKKQSTPGVVKVRTSDGKEFSLSADIVRKYLVSGGGNVNDEEIRMFMALCQYRGLNPWTRDVYLIKYGSNSPAAMVVSKNVYMRRAQRQPSFRGYKSGIIVQDEDGTAIKLDGTFYTPETQTLVGGWAEVYIEGWNVPLFESVRLEEYIGRKKDGEVNGQWATRPATMIQKVALVHALREAYPEELGGLYVQEEVSDVVDVILDETPREPQEAPKAVEAREQPPMMPKTAQRSPESVSSGASALFGGA